MLIGHHDGEELALEDGVPVLAFTFHTVKLIIPRAGHHRINFVIFGLFLPLWAGVGDQVRSVHLLGDGDVRETSLQPLKLLILQKLFASITQTAKAEDNDEHISLKYGATYY